MDLLVVAGNINEMFYTKISYKKNIINKKETYTSELIDIIQNNHIRFDAIMIMDEGIDQSLEELEEMIRKVKPLLQNKQVIYITRDLELRELLKDNQVYFQDRVRISWTDYEEIFKQVINEIGPAKKSFLGDKRNRVQETRQESAQQEYKENTEVNAEVKTEVKKEKISLLDKFKRNKTKSEPEEDKRFRFVSSGISRVIAVTGHRGVGVTSTVVNLAYEAAQKNLSTIVIDLDIYNRTTNLYFGEFIRQVDGDEYMASSLVKCLAKPQDYKNAACNVSSKLWLTTLSYEFEDNKLISQFYNTTKLMNMITVFRQYFNIILIDIPLEILGQFPESIPMIDLFALCTNNNQYSVISTLRNIGNYFTTQDIGYINAKSKLIITKFNDRAEYENDFFTPDKVSELFDSELCDELTTKMPVAGYVRYNETFDLQIENDIPISQTNMDFKEYYSNILLRLIEGGN